MRTITWLLVSLNSKWPSCLAECDPEQSDQAARQEWRTHCNDREEIIDVLVCVREGKSKQDAIAVIGS